MPREKIKTEEKKQKVLEKIGAAKNANDLSKIRKEAKGQKVSAEFDAKIDELKLNIQKIGATTEKKARKEAGDKGAVGAKKLEEKALAAAEKVEAETKKEVAVIEAGEATLETKTGKFGAEHTQADYSKYRARQVAERLATASAGNSAVTGTGSTTSGEFNADEKQEFELNPTVTKAGTSADLNKRPKASDEETTTNELTGESKEDEQEEVGEENEPGEPFIDDPEAVPQNLDEARAEFFAVYKEVEQSIGWGDRAHRFVFGKEKTDYPFESAEENNPGIEGKYLTAQHRYRRFLAEKGTEMIAQGQTKADVQEMIYNELKAKQESLDPIIPEKVRNIVSKGLGWYTKMPKYPRMILSTAIMTAGFVVAGKVAATGAVAYGGTRLARSLVGGAVGQALVSLKNKFWNADKDAVKIEKEIRSKIEGDIPDSEMDYDTIKELEHIYQEKLDKEHKARVKHLAVDFGIRMMSGMGVSYLGGLIENHDWSSGTDEGKIEPTPTSEPVIEPKPDVTPDPTPTDTPDPVVDPTHSHYEFKEIKVDYSSKGSIDTWAQIKHKLIDAYKDVDPADTPPEYKHIMESRADDLAKEFGEFRPDAIDGKESLNMLKGSSIEFTKDGTVISHSLRNASGVAEDHNLISRGADGTGVIKPEENERFFDYQKPATQVSTESNDASQFGDPNAEPVRFQSGIDDHSRAGDFGKTDSNGFVGKSTLNPHQFESHGNPGEAGDDSTASEGGPADTRDTWDGKHHSKHWYKTHTADGEEGHTIRWLKRHPEYGQQQQTPQAPLAQGDNRPYLGGTDQQIDRAFQQTGQNYDNQIQQPTHDSRIMDPHPRGYHYGTNLNGEQLDRILNSRVRYIGENFKELYANDPALPLYQVIHDHQLRFPMEPNESVAKYLGRIRIQDQQYFATMQYQYADRWDWFRRNGFFG